MWIHTGLNLRGSQSYKFNFDLLYKYSAIVMLAEDEKNIKTLIKILKQHDLDIRREKLMRGDAFRVKSGACNFKDKQLIFIDKRMPADQQLSAIIDYVVDAKINFAEGEKEMLPISLRSLL